MHLEVSKQIVFFYISVWQEKTTDSSAKSSSHLNVHPNGPPYAPPMMPIDTDDGISYKGLPKNLVFFFFSPSRLNRLDWIKRSITFLTSLQLLVV